MKVLFTASSKPLARRGRRWLLTLATVGGGFLAVEKDVLQCHYRCHCHSSARPAQDPPFFLFRIKSLSWDWRSAHFFPVSRTLICFIGISLAALCKCCEYAHNLLSCFLFPGGLESVRASFFFFWNCNIVGTQWISFHFSFLPPILIGRAISS